ncbi:MAG: hypothetical protein CMJ19_01795 [Phycisphaeraceae bacterium]|nr:hypothetical protein [Phycisphaeraceae bacterium]
MPLLIRCPHCDHRILVRNARPRSYQLACPKCHDGLYLLIEGEPGPDQRLSVFKDINQLKNQVSKARATRPSQKFRATDPVLRPESPELIHGTSASSQSAEDDDDMDYIVPQRPDSPVSLASSQDPSMIEDDRQPDAPKVDDHLPDRILPHAAPVAFGSDDEDKELDLLEEALQQVNEAHMMAPEESDQKVDDGDDVPILRPDSPRVTEEEATVNKIRPEFSVVDEVIPTFPTDKQQQEMHPDLDDADHLLMMNAQDLQAAEPSMLLEISSDEDDAAGTDASMDIDPPDVTPTLSAGDEADNTAPNTGSPSSLKGWRKWFGKS